MRMAHSVFGHWPMENRQDYNLFQRLFSRWKAMQIAPGATAKVLIQLCWISGYTGWPHCIQCRLLLNLNPMNGCFAHSSTQLNNLLHFLVTSKNTRHTCMYIYSYLDTNCIYTDLWEKVQTINTYACMHACMYVWMDVCKEKSQINRVLKEVCTQLGMLRCKIYVVIFLGEPNT